MSLMAKTGLVLLIIGVIAVLVALVSFKSKKELFRIGEFRATTTREKKIPEVGYGGGGLILVGGLLLVVGSRKSRGR